MDTYTGMVLAGLIFLASLVSVELGISAAIIEILFGVFAGNYLGIRQHKGRFLDLFSWTYKCEPASLRLRSKKPGRKSRYECPWLSFLPVSTANRNFISVRHRSRDSRPNAGVGLEFHHKFGDSSRTENDLFTKLSYEYCGASGNI